MFSVRRELVNNFSGRTTVASRNSKTDRNRSRPSGVPMAAAPVSMCPPAGLLLGVNRPCARNLICARARAPCVLSPRGSFRLDVPLRNRGALFAPSALVVRSSRAPSRHARCALFKKRAEYTKPKRSAQQPPSDPQPKIRQARPGSSRERRGFAPPRVSTYCERAAASLTRPLHLHRCSRSRLRARDPALKEPPSLQRGQDRRPVL